HRVVLIGMQLLDLLPGRVQLRLRGSQLRAGAGVELQLVALRVAGNRVFRAGEGRQRRQRQQQGQGDADHPTEPSSETSSSFLASTANSIGSSRKTCLQNPSTISETASSSEMPRERQSTRLNSSHV